MLLRAGEVDAVASRPRPAASPSGRPAARGSAGSPTCGRPGRRRGRRCPRPVNRSISAAGSVVSARRSRSPIVSFRRRNEPGRLDRADAGRAAEDLDEGRDVLLGLVEVAAGAAAGGSSRSIPSRISCSVRSDRPRTVRIRPASAAACELVHGRDPELLVELADGLRAEPGDLEELDEARRDLRAEPLEIRHPAGRHELGDLVADRLADAADLRRVAGAVGGDEIDRAAADRVGGAVVGDRLERDLALDLEDVADLVEDPGEVAVRQVGGLVGEDVGRRVVVRRGCGGRCELGEVARRRPSEPACRSAMAPRSGRVDCAASRPMVARAPASGRGPPAARGSARPRRPGRGRGAWRRTGARSACSIDRVDRLVRSSATAAPTETLTAATPSGRGRARATASRTRSPTSTATSSVGLRSRTANSSPP